MSLGTGYLKLGFDDNYWGRKSNPHTPYGASDLKTPLSLSSLLDDLPKSHVLL